MNETSSYAFLLHLLDKQSYTHTTVYNSTYYAVLQAQIQKIVMLLAKFRSSVWTSVTFVEKCRKWKGLFSFMLLLYDMNVMSESFSSLSLILFIYSLAIMCWLGFCVCFIYIFYSIGFYQKTIENKPTKQKTNKIKYFFFVYMKIEA